VQTLMGSETVVHGLQAYVSNNNPMSIIVIIPDSFGWQFTNTRRIADEFCEKTGATVYVPDFMNGFVLPTFSDDFCCTVHGEDITMTLFLTCQLPRVR